MSFATSRAFPLTARRGLLEASLKKSGSERFAHAQWLVYRKNTSCALSQLRAPHQEKRSGVLCTKRRERYRTRRTTPRDAPGNKQCHLASAVVGELYEEVSRLLADVPVEHGNLQEVGQRGLVVQGEVEPHRALARIRALRFQQGRQNKLPYHTVRMISCEKGM